MIPGIITSISYTGLISRLAKDYYFFFFSFFPFFILVTFATLLPMRLLELDIAD